LKVLIVIFCLVILAATANTNILNQEQICTLLGEDLINKCVENQGDLEECLETYAAYIICINQLNKPLTNKYLRQIDNYKNNQFSPCGYEVSHLILHNKCH
jgi:hypothetical protein